MFIIIALVQTVNLYMNVLLVEGPWIYKSIILLGFFQIMVTLVVKWLSCLPSIIAE